MSGGRRPPQGRDDRRTSDAKREDGRERDRDARSDDERARAERGDDDRVGDLGEDIARKWDPDRLLRAVSKRAGRGRRLDATTRARYERKLGADLGGVRVVTGEFAERVTQAHSAEAVTVGSTGMILMRGSPDMSPVGASGRALLAHELTHVAQAQRGVHRAPTFGSAAPLATEQHEAEAEQQEASEYAEAFGEPAAGEQAAGPAGGAHEVSQAVIERVLELFEEEERLWALRNGMP